MAFTSSIAHRSLVLFEFSAAGSDESRRNSNIETAIYASGSRFSEPRPLLLVSSSSSAPKNLSSSECSSKVHLSRSKPLPAPGESVRISTSALAVDSLTSSLDTAPQGKSSSRVPLLLSGHPSFHASSAVGNEALIRAAAAEALALARAAAKAARELKALIGQRSTDPAENTAGPRSNENSRVLSQRENKPESLRQFSGAENIVRANCTSGISSFVSTLNNKNELIDDPHFAFGDSAFDARPNRAPYSSSGFSSEAVSTFGSAASSYGSGVGSRADSDIGLKTGSHGTRTGSETISGFELTESDMARLQSARTSVLPTLEDYASAQSNILREAERQVLQFDYDFVQPPAALQRILDGWSNLPDLPAGKLNGDFDGGFPTSELFSGANPLGFNPFTAGDDLLAGTDGLSDGSKNPCGNSGKVDLGFYPFSEIFDRCETDVGRLSPRLMEAIEIALNCRKLTEDMTQSAQAAGDSACALSEATEQKTKLAPTLVSSDASRAADVAISETIADLAAPDASLLVVSADVAFADVENDALPLHLAVRSEKKALRQKRRENAARKMLSKLQSLTAGGGGAESTSARAKAVRASAAEKEMERLSDLAGSGADGGRMTFMTSFNLGCVPKLLTAQEEVLLSKQVQILMKLERLRTDLSKQYGRPPSKLEWAQAAKLSSQELSSKLRKAKACKDRMVQSNVRLVYSVAKKYTGKGVMVEDLITEGIMGLMRAVEKFDPNRGFKFSTYAHWWIKQAITRSVAEQSRTIRLPMHMYEIVSRINKARAMLSEELGRAPSEAEVSELVGVSEKRLGMVMRHVRAPTSMEKPLGHESEETLGEMVADQTLVCPEEEITESLLKSEMESVLNTLTPRERDVLKVRYGLEDGRMKTLEEVGGVFRLTRERIRQIETKALRKLRSPQRSVNMKAYVNDISSMEEREGEESGESGGKDEGTEDLGVFGLNEFVEVEREFDFPFDKV